MCSVKVAGFPRGKDSSHCTLLNQCVTQTYIEGNDFIFFFRYCYDKLLFLRFHPSDRFGMACNQEEVICLYDILYFAKKENLCQLDTNYKSSTPNHV